MGTYRGFIETFIEVEADNEGDAEKKMASILIDRLKSSDAGFIAWEIEAPTASHGSQG